MTFLCMAFNWQTFKTRTLTAAVFVVVMLTGLLWNQWSFFILFSIIHFGCWWEYQKLVGLIDNGYQKINWFHKYGVMVAGWCVMLYFTNETFSIGSLQFHEIGKWGGISFLFIAVISALSRPKNIAHSIFGLLYISLSLGLMVGFNFGNDFHDNFSTVVIPNNFIPLVIVASIWVNDTMAYIVGSLIGKTQLSKISPKKTWEGTIGGIILCLTVMGLISFLWIDQKIFTIFAIIISAIASVAGTLGDLLESKLKRMAGVKDSGHIMPGHGGFLDRFDSMLLAIPAVWLYVYFFMS